MKILAIIGSPRGKGCTYEMIRRVEERMTSLDADVSFEYLILKEANVDLCKGCYVCLDRGEACCPLHDDRALIESKMNAADGVIFATPVYVCNVPWIMKNFIDRFAYRSHRPAFHNKPALIAATTGGVGLGFVLPTLAFTVGTWGFGAAARLGIAIAPGTPANDTLGNERNVRKIKKAADSFYERMKMKKVKKPGLTGLIAFRLQRKAFSNSDKAKADYRYWSEKGWFDKKSEYYYPTRVNPVMKAIAALTYQLFCRFK